jgi:hypothetical protein
MAAARLVLSAAVILTVVGPSVSIADTAKRPKKVRAAGKSSPLQIQVDNECIVEEFSANGQTLRSLTVHALVPETWTTSTGAVKTVRNVWSFRCYLESRDCDGFFLNLSDLESSSHFRADSVYRMGEFARIVGLSKSDATVQFLDNTVISIDIANERISIIDKTGSSTHTPMPCTYRWRSKSATP